VRISPGTIRVTRTWVETVAWGRRELGTGFIVFKEAKGLPEDKAKDFRAPGGK
jgi:hypothetical protein